MRAVLLGTGSPPPNPTRRGPATLLSLGDARFLVDAGSGVGAQLVQAGVRAWDWPPVFITHHHSDHTIDLGHLLISRWIAGQNAAFEIWGPAGTQRQVDKLLDYLSWDMEVRRSHMHEPRHPAVVGGRGARRRAARRARGGHALARRRSPSPARARHDLRGRRPPAYAGDPRGVDRGRRATGRARGPQPEGLRRDSGRDRAS